MRHFGNVQVDLPNGSGTLAVYCLSVYGGGIFIPFKDSTNGITTYGGGRYLLDTIKGADLGSDPETFKLVLDFNYAYHPSCCYNDRWICPLAQSQSVLKFKVEAGEMLTEDLQH